MNKSYINKVYHLVLILFFFFLLNPLHSQEVRNNRKVNTPNTDLPPPQQPSPPPVEAELEYGIFAKIDSFIANRDSLVNRFRLSLEE